jgi:hypothetical protein
LLKLLSFIVSNTYNIEVFLMMILMISILYYRYLYFFLYT